MACWKTLPAILEISQPLLVSLEKADRLILRPCFEFLSLLEESQVASRCIMLLFLPCCTCSLKFVLWELDMALRSSGMNHFDDKCMNSWSSCQDALVEISRSKFSFASLGSLLIFIMIFECVCFIMLCCSPRLQRQVFTFFLVLTTQISLSYSMVCCKIGSHLCLCSCQKSIPSCSIVKAIWPQHALADQYGQRRE